MLERIDYFFSFRSPFSWLALRKMQACTMLRDFDVVHLPIWPRTIPPVFHTEEKVTYMNEDMQRLKAKHGMDFALPTVFDCEWSLPHGAFMAAQDRGHGADFAEALFDARFAKDQDLGSPVVIGEIAGRLGLDRDDIIHQARDPHMQERLAKMRASFVQAKGFGVPLWVVRNERFWGQDRFDALCERLSSFAGSSLAGRPARGSKAGRSSKAG
jgi:2-hydroxychromene-2-carboxylate isomerase